MSHRQQKDVERSVRQIAAEYFGVEPSAITSNMNLEEHFELDSIDRLNILMDVEDYFDVDLHEDLFDEVNTVEGFTNKLLVHL